VALCDHDSTDDSHLLPELFAQRGIGGVVLDRAPKPRQTVSAHATESWAHSHGLHRRLQASTWIMCSTQHH